MPSSMVCARSAAGTVRSKSTLVVRIISLSVGAEKGYTRARRRPLEYVMFPSCSDRSNTLYFLVTPTGAGIEERCGGHAGHAGPAHPQSAVAPTHAWLGHHEPDSGDVSGHLPDRPGLVVSRPASLRAARLGDVVLAGHGEQSPCEVLRSHGSRKAGDRARDRPLAPLRRGRGSGVRGLAGRGYFARILL